MYCGNYNSLLLAIIVAVSVIAVLQSAPGLFSDVIQWVITSRRRSVQRHNISAYTVSSVNASLHCGQLYRAGLETS